MARHFVGGTARDTTTGMVRANTTIAVYLAGTTTPASIYAAPTGGTAVNSVLTDTNGYFSFYVDEADYALTQRFKILSVKTGYDTITYDSLAFFSLDAVDTDGTMAANSDKKVPTQKAVVTYSQAKNANLTALSGLTLAANKLAYATGAGALALTDLTAYARTLLDDDDAAAFLTTLGVTTFAQTILDDTDAAGMRSTIDAQQLNANLTALAGLSGAANKLINFTGAGTMVLIDRLPVGAIIAMPISTVPAGFLECNGAAVSKTTYADLYAVLKDGGAAGIYGESTTFNLPDYRGQFLRGWAHGQTTDPDRATRTDRGDTTGGDVVGSKQDHAAESHDHTMGTFVDGTPTYFSNSGGAAYVWIVSGVKSTGSYGGNETRPVNINVMFCIKY